MALAQFGGTGGVAELDPGKELQQELDIEEGDVVPDQAGTADPLEQFDRERTHLLGQAELLGAGRERPGEPDGTWMIVEPMAADRVEGNLNPVGRAYYSFSTLLCTPASLSQDVGLALGAQAGEARIADVVGTAGFTRFRRAAETPFNIVFEARH